MTQKSISHLTSRQHGPHRLRNLPFREARQTGTDLNTQAAEQADILQDDLDRHGER